MKGSRIDDGSPLLPELDDGYLDLDPNVLDELLAKAKPNHDYVMRLRDQGRVSDEHLEIIRDLFIGGQDVDAIAILSTELGLMPRETADLMLKERDKLQAWFAYWEAFKTAQPMMEHSKIQDEVFRRFETWWSDKQREEAWTRLVKNPPTWPWDGTAPEVK